MALHPSVIWAQRKNCVFLTICLEDCKDPEIKTEKGGIFFKGKGGSDQKEYVAELEFFANIDPANSLNVIRPRNIEFCLKKEEENFWPRLLKSSSKVPWLKIDFNKWKDEDDSEDEGVGVGPGGPGGDGGDFEEMMRQMGGLGGGMGGLGGMGGMGGLGGDKPSLNDMDDSDHESDQEDDLPDLE